MPISFVLAAKPGTQMSEIRTVITHPHAAAQTRQWVHTHLPQAIVTERGSTAGAAKTVSDSDDFDAAICADVAAQRYGLEVLAKEVADNDAAVTRFVLVGPAGRPVARTQADKTTLVVYMYEDRSGALLDILQQFAVHGVNLTRIESRPTKVALGSYYFSIDAEGHIDDARMAETLMGLKRCCKRVAFLGSYPRADGVQATVPHGGTDDDYASARQWLAGITDGWLKER